MAAITLYTENLTQDTNINTVNSGHHDLNDGPTVQISDTGIILFSKDGTWTRTISLDQIQPLAIFKEDSTFSIFAAAFPIPYQMGRFAPAAHDFLLLYIQGHKDPVAALHGLCAFVDPDDPNSPGERLPIGGWNPNHRLRAYHCVYNEDFSREYGFPIDRYALAPVETKQVYQGPDAVKFWAKTVHFTLPQINGLNKHYPLLGIGFESPILNSNSVYFTFFKAMLEDQGIEPHRFSWRLQPGWGNDLRQLESSQLTGGEKRPLLSFISATADLYA